jgi:hypothetical protein
MQTIHERLGLKQEEDHVWMIDRYQMGRFKFQEFSILDRFSEGGGRYGNSRMYFWQHRAKDGCTVKVNATITDSNESAHTVMHRFMSRVSHPTAFSPLEVKVHDSHWFKMTEAEEVQIVNHGGKQLAAVLIWGNIFFHIESNGEQDHSIKSFLKNLGDYWGGIRRESAEPYDFTLLSTHTALKEGEATKLVKRGLINEEEYSTIMYVAGPRRLVRIYKDRGDVKLVLKTRPHTDKVILSPFAMVIGIRPDGHFVRSNLLKLNIASE